MIDSDGNILVAGLCEGIRPEGFEPIDDLGESVVMKLDPDDTCQSVSEMLFAAGAGAVYYVASILICG